MAGVLSKICFRHPKPFVIKFAPVIGVFPKCDLFSMLYTYCIEGKVHAVTGRQSLAVLGCISERSPCARVGSGYDNGDK